MTTTGYSDTFDRTAASSLGTASSGQVYALQGVASQFSVTPNTASIAISSSGDKFGYIDLQTQNVDITGQVALSAIPATNLATVGYVSKLANTNNYYNATMMVAAGGAVSLRFSKLVGAALSTISTTAVTGLTYVANTYYNLRYQIFWSRPLQTNVMSLKLWAVGAVEPGGWMATATEASFTDYTAGTHIGIFGRDESTSVGSVIARHRNVAARSYLLPMPASTDTMCASVGEPTDGFCSIAVADGGFESGAPAADSWYVEGGTLAGDDAYAHSGAWSALVTTVGAPGQLVLRNSATVAAVEDDVVNAQMWVRTSVAGDVLAVIDYYAAGNTYLSSDSATFPVLANVWTPLTVEGAGAPATTVRVEYGPTIFGPTAGTLMRVDDVDILEPCSVPAVMFPQQTAIQVLADAVDAAMVTLDPLTSLAGLFPRVRVSNTALTINTAVFVPLAYNATEFNIGTSTNLGYDNTSLYLPSGIWLVTYEIRLAEAASNYIQISFFGTGPNVGEVVVDIRSNAAQANDQGVGGCGHVSALTYSTDPTTPIQFGVSFLANNPATTYTVQYMALSAIKISDYFA